MAKLQPEGRLEEEQERQVKLVEVGLHDPRAGVAKDGETLIYVAGAAGMVGKRVKVRITRVLDGFAYAELVGAPGAAAEPPITAEAPRSPPVPAARGRSSRRRRRRFVTVAEEAEVAQEPGPRSRWPKRLPTRSSRSARRRGADARRPEAEEEAGGCGRRAGRER